MKNPWIIIALITISLFGGAFWLANQAQEANNDGITTTTQVKGNPDATVVLEEYSDFQCPACSQAAPFVAELLAEYSDQIRFEYKHFPLPSHPYAEQAAMAAEAAGQQGQFFAFHDMLFDKQSEWSSSPTPQVHFAQYAADLGLDVDQFTRQSKASLLRDKARADMREGRERGITGTPTFFLNGEMLRAENGQNLSYADMAALIIAAVDPSVASSTPQSDDVNVVGEAAGAPVRFGL